MISPSITANMKKTYIGFPVTSAVIMVAKKPKNKIIAVKMIAPTIFINTPHFVLFIT